MGVNSPNKPHAEMLPWTIELTIDLPQKARWLAIYFEKIECMSPKLNAIGWVSIVTQLEFQQKTYRM